jgi:hypothetical protein
MSVISGCCQLRWYLRRLAPGCVWMRELLDAVKKRILNQAVGKLVETFLLFLKQPNNLRETAN